MSERPEERIARGLKMCKESIDGLCRMFPDAAPRLQQTLKKIEQEAKQQLEKER